jgi:hypothetical protein
MDQDHSRLDVQLVCKNNQKKLHQKLESKTKEIKDLSIQLGYSLLIRNQQKGEKELLRTYGQAKDELRKAKTSLNFYKTQFEHESRKFSKEREKLKEKLAKLINDKSKAPPSTISMTATLPPKLETVDHEDKKDEMYDIVISNYEEREKELLQENSFLRQLLYDFYRSLEAKTQNELEDLEEEVHDGFTTHESIHQAIFQLPLEMMRETVLGSFDKSLEQLLNVFKLSASQSDEVAELKVQLETMEAEIQEHKKQLEAKIVYTKESMAEKVNEEIKQKYMDLEIKQKQLDEDRKRFAEAAIKMGLERAALQREKVALAAMKEEKVKPALRTVPSTPTYLSLTLAG